MNKQKQCSMQFTAMTHSSTDKRTCGKEKKMKCTR